MSPLRTRMIEDMTLAGCCGDAARPTRRRCAGWQRVTGAHPISSAKRKYVMLPPVASTGRGARYVQDWLVRSPRPLLPPHTPDRDWDLFREKKDRLQPGQKRLPHALS